MTIELITGGPGAGKTCYGVSQRIAAEVGRKVTVEDQFEQPMVVTRRVVIAGIRGLKVDHERLPHPLTGERVSTSDVEEQNKVDSEGEPVYKRLPGDPPHEVEATLFNWWRWCMPGDLIVCDEVQYIVARGTLNKKQPHFIGAMATHRHYGVDFLFITQHPDFLDPFIRKLVTLHRHVRSMMASSLCTLYTWDHASTPERYNLANKSVWVRRAKHFRLYKSSVAHVKPPSAGRAILVILPVMAAVVFYGFGDMKARIAKAGGTVTASTGAPAAAAAAASAASAAVAYTPPKYRTVVVDGKPLPKISGCYATRTSCSCIDASGFKVAAVPESTCRASTTSFDGAVAWEPRANTGQAAPAGAYGAAVGQVGVMAAARPASAPAAVAPPPPPPVLSALL